MHVKLKASIKFICLFLCSSAFCQCDTLALDAAPKRMEKKTFLPHSIHTFGEASVQILLLWVFLAKLCDFFFLTSSAFNQWIVTLDTTAKQTNDLSHHDLISLYQLLFFTLALPVSRALVLTCRSSDSQWEMIFWLVCHSDAQPSLWDAGQAFTSCSSSSHCTQVSRELLSSCPNYLWTMTRAIMLKKGRHWLFFLG